MLASVIHARCPRVGRISRRSLALIWFCVIRPQDAAAWGSQPEALASGAVLRREQPPLDASSQQGQFLSDGGLMAGAPLLRRMRGPTQELGPPFWLRPPDPAPPASPAQSLQPQSAPQFA